MKIPRLEAMRRSQREYHRTHPWGLSQGGLYIPYTYTHMVPDSLSSWDDVGFIMNKRRVMVSWQHPRYVYKEALRTKAWAEVGDGPRDNWLFEGGTPNYKKVGRSRKRIVSYTSRAPSEEQQAHYARLTATIERLTAEGIGLDISPSWKWSRTRWAMGVSLIVPLEVRSEAELAQVAQLAKRLIRQETSLEREFPGYSYGRKEWLEEQANCLKAENL